MSKFKLKTKSNPKQIKQLSNFRFASRFHFLATFSLILSKLSLVSYAGFIAICSFKFHALYFILLYYSIKCICRIGIHRNPRNRAKSIIDFGPSNAGIPLSRQNCALWFIFKLRFSWLFLALRPMDTMNEGKELSMEDLLGQLGDFSEYNELKQKVSQIEKSKVCHRKDRSNS